MDLEGGGKERMDGIMWIASRELHFFKQLSEILFSDFFFTLRWISGISIGVGLLWRSLLQTLREDSWTLGLMRKMDLSPS